MRFFLLPLLFFVISSSFAAAQGDDPFRSTPYPLPRFVSLTSDKVYVRTGPGSLYPIKWEYRRRGLPVEIILEFDTWRKVRDYEGQEGWVHQSLLTGRRAAIMQGEDNIPVRRKPGRSERLVAYLEPMVVTRLERCLDKWCEIEVSGYQGWVERKFIWGVYENEKFD